MNVGKTIGVVLLVGAMFGVLAACEKKEGPMEQAGKSVDSAVNKVGEKVEKAEKTFRTQPRAKRNSCLSAITFACNSSLGVKSLPRHWQTRQCGLSR
jgi:hypothetical protein